jgi:hypothetical protein
MSKALAIRVPLIESDPDDIIGEIDSGRLDLIELIKDRFEDVMLNVETGDSLVH